MRLLVSSLPFFVAFAGFGQDSLLTVNDLSFNSDFEKRSFTEYDQALDPGYFNIFLSVDPMVSIEDAKNFQRKYEALVNELSASKYLRKSNDKKIKGLYKQIHDALLTKYQIKNHFSEIFAGGNYNCVSATAIYGLIFNDLDIPYAVKEKPTHVYLMAYPSTEGILVETTDPSGQFLAFNNRYKTAVVTQLKEAKLISLEEFNSKSVDQLFDEFYFSDQDIGLRELAGLQYSNDALYKLENNEVKAGHQQLEKAYFLYSNDKLATMLLITNLQILEEIGYKDIESMKYLVKLSKIHGLGVTQENIVAEFARMTQVQLTNKGDTSTYKNFYNEFISMSRNEGLNSEISYVYNLERGLALYNMGNYDSAVPFIDKAYSLKPQNLDIIKVYIGIIGEKLRFESQNKNAIKVLEDVSAKHPALLENTAFKSLLLNAYVIEFGQSFDLNKAGDGMHYKRLFEENYEDGLNVYTSNIGRAYSTAAVYYFRKGHTSKAKAIINTGLSYAPGNHELLTRKRMIR